MEAGAGNNDVPPKARTSGMASVLGASCTLHGMVCVYVRMACAIAANWSKVSILLLGKQRAHAQAWGCRTKLGT